MYCIFINFYVYLLIINFLLLVILIYFTPRYFNNFNFKNYEVTALDDYYYDYNRPFINRKQILNDLTDRISIDKKFKYLTKDSNLFYYYFKNSSNFINYDIKENSQFFSEFIDFHFCKNLKINNYLREMYDYSNENQKFSIPIIFLPRLDFKYQYTKSLEDYKLNNQSKDYLSKISIFLENLCLDYNFFQKNSSELQIFTELKILAGALEYYECNKGKEFSIEDNIWYRNAFISDLRALMQKILLKLHKILAIQLLSGDNLVYTLKNQYNVNFTNLKFLIIYLELFLETSFLFNDLSSFEDTKILLPKDLEIYLINKINQ